MRSILTLLMRSLSRMGGHFVPFARSTAPNSIEESPNQPFRVGGSPSNSSMPSASTGSCHVFRIDQRRLRCAFRRLSIPLLRQSDHRFRLMSFNLDGTVIAVIPKAIAQGSSGLGG